MRIINVTEDGRWAGAQARLAMVARELKAEGVESCVICPSENSAYFRSCLDEMAVYHVAVEMHRPTRRLKPLMRYLTRYAPEVVRIKNVIERNGGELVHCNGSWQTKGAIAGYLANVPVIWHLNDTGISRAIEAVFKGIGPILADAFIVSSSATRDHYLTKTRLRKVPHRIIHPPVDTEVFDPKAVAPDRRLVTSSGVKIVTIATINPNKGIEVFIKMSQRVTQRLGRKVNFFVVGPVYESQREYGEHLKQLVVRRGCHNVYFLGSSNDIPGILAAADVFVCSSFREAGPMTVFEAMAMATPVVSTDVGDVKETFERMGTGARQVVPVGDAERLAQSVIELVEDEALRGVIGEAQRRYAERHLDVRVCAIKHAEFYREIVGERG